MDFKIGDHLVSPRMYHSYTHHGLYIGKNEVIHYSGFADGMKRGKIERASIQEFANGHSIRIEKHKNRKYTEEKSIDRAESRLGEDWYNVLFNNCEHFVNWCIEGKHESVQVNNAIELISHASYAKTETLKHKRIPGLGPTVPIPSPLPKTPWITAETLKIFTTTTAQETTKKVAIAATSNLVKDTATKSVTGSVIGGIAGASTTTAVVGGAAAAVTGVAAAPVVLGAAAGAYIGKKIWDKLFD